MPTMERIARAAAALKSADPSLRAEDTAAAAGNTVAELMSNLTRASRLRAFFHRQGLTDHDVVLFPLVIMSAMIALNDPTLAYIQPVSADQIDFYKRHRLALDAIFLDDSPPAKPGKR
ncbi:hypothetical protein [Sphingomonas bacterium]|uniref:hypothetical protein n=1 Tax=Sphingomonas bacterium TaxID=1895847 RepID=UPI001C2D30B6|nr:hypothetical protein [Sphingomonas bacterium]